MPTGRANARPMTGSTWRLEGWMQHVDSRPSFETLAEFIIGKDRPRPPDRAVHRMAQHLQNPPPGGATSAVYRSAAGP
jgi:hypothetical protein